MVRSRVHTCLLGILVICAGLLGSVPAAAQQPNEYDLTVARVIRLLPRPPEKVVVVDADTSGRSLHDKLQHVEGFVPYGAHVVYLVKQSDTLQQAINSIGYAGNITIKTSVGTASPISISKPTTITAYGGPATLH